MNWNPFKRIANLERDVRTQAAQLSDLNRNLGQLELKVQAQGKWLATLESRLQDLNQTQGKLLVTFESRLQDLSNPVTITRADVEKETKARLKRAAYSRKYYANKRAEAAKAAAGGAK